MIRPLTVAALSASVALGGLACSAGQPVALTVFAAASLKTALDQMKPAYEGSHAGTSITVSTGSSSALRTQIEQGAPADVFLSADTSNPDALAHAARTDGPPVPFATNELTVVVPDGNPGGITTPADLARSNATIIAAGEDVPITRYAEQCISKLAALGGYPADFAAAYEANIASREDNVGAVASKLKLGEGDAAIVYVTDASAAHLQTVEIPSEANVTATYAGVVTATSASKSLAHEFLHWVRGSAGQRILANLGFLPAS